MPRKSSKVSAIPVEQVEVEHVDEPVTEAEQMTELVKVIEDDKVTSAALADVMPTDAVSTEAVAEEAVKPKAKRAPRAKKEKVVADELREAKANALPEASLGTEPVIDVPPQVPPAAEVVSEAVPPEAPPAAEQTVKENKKVECPDCGKSMSAKTLRYSHGPNCLFKKQADKEYNQAMMAKVPEEVIEAEVQKRMSCAKAERLSRRQKQIETLVQNAF